MKLVIIESPFAASAAYTQAHHEAYARACMADCLSRGEAPYASHLLYTQPGVLDDTIPEQRKLGMLAGFAWRAACDTTVVYQDLGMSGGMVAGVQSAKDRGNKVEFRRLPVAVFLALALRFAPKVTS